MEIDLKGHSGCIVEVVRDGSSLYVQKSTSDKKYVNRLDKQARKQISALMFSHPVIKVPKIFSLETDDDHCVIKMEYVYSKNYIDYLETVAPEQLRNLVSTVIEYIEREISISPDTKIRSSLVKHKFQDVRNNIQKNELLKDSSEIHEILEKVSLVINDLPEHFIIPVGICHGDLTFSNVLFTDISYYLIDFLDSFIETPLMDIVKIRQDTAYLWSVQMYEGNRIDVTRLKIISEKIDTDIHNYFSGKYKWYRDLYYHFQLMNFLRILQYANDERIVDYLKNILKDLLNDEA